MSQIQKTGTRIIRRGLEESETLTADVCVVGAGCAGIMAALQSARLGKKVILADASPLPGGQSTNSNIGLFCGLYSRTPDRYRFTYGIVDELLLELGEADALYYRDSGVTVSVVYDEQALLRWIDRHLEEEKIVFLSGACLEQVEKEDRRLYGAVFLTRYGRVKVNARAFVDATGDAALTYMAGLPCRVSDEGPVYGTQMVVADQVDFSELPSDNEIRSCILEKARQYGVERQDGLAFSFPNRNRLIINMTHIETPLAPVEASVSAVLGRTRAERAYRFLKEQYPKAFQNAFIHSYGQTGIRQTRWIVGVHQLLAEEIRKGIKFEDTVARTTWPIELHDTLATHQWEPFDAEHIHYVPFGAMVPPDADNLVAAGRCIDADLIALSSVRVMGPCMAMGMAAAHALDLAGSGSVHNIDMEKLQDRIRDNLERRTPLAADTNMISGKEGKLL